MKLYKISVNKKTNNKNLKERIKKLKQIRNQQNDTINKLNQKLDTINKLNQKLNQKAKIKSSPSKKRLIQNSKSIDRYIKNVTKNTSQQLRLARLLNIKYFMTKAPAYTFSEKGVRDRVEATVGATRYQYNLTHNEGVEMVKQEPTVWCFKIYHDSGKKINTDNTKAELITERFCFYKPAESNDGKSTIRDAITNI